MKQQADKEFVAMRRIIETLQSFDGVGRQRIMSYVQSRIPSMGEPQLMTGVPFEVKVSDQVGQPALPLK